jgi:hypothetical protein
MNDRAWEDSIQEQAHQRFTALVQSTGTKRFAASMGLSTRQINRMISGAQPNPIERIIRTLQSSEPEIGDRTLDYICQEMGGHFVRHEALDSAAVNAVKECAEAIAAMSDGEYCDITVKEIREAISALSSIIIALRRETGQDGKGDGTSR